MTPAAVISLCRQIAGDTALNESSQNKRCNCIRRCLIRTGCSRFSSARLKNLSQLARINEVCLSGDPELQREKTFGAFAAHGLRGRQEIFAARAQL